MARAYKEVEFDGIRVKLVQLPAMRGLRFFREVVDILGPAITELGDVSDLGSMDLGKFKPVINQLMMNLSEERLERLTKTLFEDAQVFWNDKWAPMFGGAGMFDMVFCGKYLTLFKILREALELNYGDFIGGLTGEAAE